MKKILSLSIAMLMGLSVININEVEAKNNKIPPGQAKKLIKKHSKNYVVRQYQPIRYVPIVTYKPGIYYFPTKYRADRAKKNAAIKGFNTTLVFLNNNWVLTIR